jgi:hypothetical protein
MQYTFSLLSCIDRHAKSELDLAASCLISVHENEI